MLAKVLKYDLKFVYKILIIFYILILFSASLTRIFWLFDDSFILNILGSIFSGVTISFIFSILINNLMRLWARMVTNVYGDESYLTHTLPVSKKTIYLSKFLSSIITMLTSVTVILLALFIAYYSKENMEFLKESLNMVATIYNSSVLRLIIVVFIVFFLEMSFVVQAGYTGIIIGHKSNNHKMLKTIIYGFCIYLLTNAFIILLLFLFGFFNPDIMNLFKTVNTLDIKIIKDIMFGAIALYTVLIFIFYIIDINLFKKGVNVE